MIISDSGLLLAAGFLVNFAISYIIVRFIYYRKKGEHNYIFTFLAFNTIVYFIMGLFTSVELSIGAGFGLFALFSILRYRTETIPIREMTYLFVMVALPILNSVFFGTGDYEKIVISNVLIIIVIWILEKGFGFKEDLFQKEILYEKIELVKAGRKDEMIEDLKKRTGLNISDVTIERIDFLRDAAHIKVFYTESTAVENEQEEIPAGAVLDKDEDTDAKEAAEVSIEINKDEASEARTDVKSEETADNKTDEIKGEQL